MATLTEPMIDSAGKSQVSGSLPANGLTANHVVSSTDLLENKEVALDGRVKGGDAVEVAVPRSNDSPSLLEITSNGSGKRRDLHEQSKQDNVVTPADITVDDRAAVATDGPKGGIAVGVAAPESNGSPAPVNATANGSAETQEVPEGTTGERELEEEPVAAPSHIEEEEPVTPSQVVIHDRGLQPWDVAMIESSAVEQNGASTTGEDFDGEWQMPENWTPDKELVGSVVLPPYLAKEITAAVHPKAATANAAQTTGVESSSAPGGGEPQEIPSSPVLVFINSRSGGRLGPSLRLSFIDLLGPAQVFDLSKVKPPHVLSSVLGCLDRLARAGDQCARAVRANLRILVAGGDGTVGWMLSSIAALKLPAGSVPPVGIVPLGTGNDLARTFGWGATFTSPRPSKVRKHLLKVAAAEPTLLDCWQIVVRPSREDFDPPIKFPHALQPQMHVPLPQAASQEDPGTSGNAFAGNFWNYFSLGMDAKIAYGFHHLREEKPWLARSRMTNQMIYAGYTCTQGWFCTPCSYNPATSGLATIAHIDVKKRVDSEWTSLELPPSVRALVLLNLQSYAGGRDPWGTPPPKTAAEKGWGDPDLNDGLMEVVGLKDGWHAALVMGKILTHAFRLDQVHAVRVELGDEGGWQNAYMQMDGEPWRQPLDTKPGGRSTFVEVSCSPTPSRVLLYRPVQSPASADASPNNSDSSQQQTAPPTANISMPTTTDA